MTTETEKEVIQDTPEVTTDEGLNPLTQRNPEFDVSIRGEDGEVSTIHYYMRNLGIVDALKLVRIITTAAIPLRDLPPGSLGDSQGIIMAILIAIPYAEEDIKDLVAGVLYYKDGNKKVKVSVEDLEDPDKFPLDALVSIIESMGNHPDLASFLKNVRRLSNLNLTAQIRDNLNPKEK